MVLITPHAVMWVFEAPYQGIFPYAISGTFISSKIQLVLYYCVIVWVWMGGADLSRSFG